MTDNNNYIENIRDYINSILLDYISVDDCKKGGKRIVDAMSYSLMIGGKRIRPALCIGAANAVGGLIKDVTPLACAIEMIHTYSLIHDDLPAMDNDILRRGKLTCHKQFDEATAILAGNALLTSAFEILTDLRSTSDLLSENILKIIHEISVAVGFKGMIGGQMQDINSEGIVLSRDQLENMHFLKTGMIIKASVVCGAIASQASDYQLRHLKKYSSKLGLAFQVMDDVLNVIGDPIKLGKSVGTDSLRGKNTYPSIVGLDVSRQSVRELICDALKALETFDEKANNLRTIANYILEKII